MVYVSPGNPDYAQPFYLEPEVREELLEDIPRLFSLQLFGKVVDLDSADLRHLVDKRMRVRLLASLLCALAVFCFLGAQPAVGSTSQAAFLGPQGGGHGWMPSRVKPRSAIWAVGDGADGQRAGLSVAATIAEHRVDRFLYLGDVYEDGTAQEWESNYRPLYARFDPIAAPTAGNHEWPTYSTGYEPYWASVRGTPPPFWYAFAASGWQLISLNSNLPSGEGSAQLAWLRKKLRVSPRYGNCRLAFSHFPRFTAGSSDNHPALEEVRRALVGHARIMLAGHDHSMERLSPVDGITQLIAGAGGHGLSPVRPDPRLVFGDGTDYGALRLKLRPGRAVLSFVAADGSLLDRSAVGCRQASP